MQRAVENSYKTVENIKDDFPLWQEGASPDLIYLDSAATTQKPVQVIEAITNYYSTSNANVHRGTYNLAEKATRLYEETRRDIQEFINADSSDEIIYVSGTTEGINLVANCFAAPILDSGSEIVVIASEHHSNLIPWQQLCHRKNARLVVAPIDKQGDIQMDKLENSLSEKTKLVAVSHISNSLGTINPVREIIKKAHKFNIPVLIDGAQNAGHHSTDVQDLDCDFYVFSGHKIYGPTGTGVLYGKSKWLEQMDPYRFGGEMVQSVSYEKTSFKKIPYKFEAGTPNIAGVAGLKAAISFLRKVGMSTVSARSKELLDYATKLLTPIDELKIIGTSETKSGIISFTIPGVHPHDVSTFLNEYGIAVRSGHHCSQPVMDFFGIPGTTRVSFGIYNDFQEIDQLVDVVKKAITYFS